MIDIIRQRFPEYDDLTDEQLVSAITGKLSQPTGVNHEHLSGPGVVTAATSHGLQNIAPDLKPVVKGSKPEVLAMRKTGRIGPEKVVFVSGDSAAYIIDPKAVQGIYGGSLQQAVTQAKKDLLKGGDAESVLLGYPKREAVAPQDMSNVAVDHEGNIITDLGQMKDAAESQNVAWAAQGDPYETMQKAEAIAQRLQAAGEA